MFAKFWYFGKFFSFKSFKYLSWISLQKFWIILALSFNDIFLAILPQRSKYKLSFELSSYLLIIWINNFFIVISLLISFLIFFPRNIFWIVIALWFSLSSISCTFCFHLSKYFFFNKSLYLSFWFIKIFSNK